MTTWSTSLPSNFRLGTTAQTPDRLRTSSLVHCSATRPMLRDAIPLGTQASHRFGGAAKEPQQPRALTDDPEHRQGRGRVAGHGLLPEAALKGVQPGDLDRAQEVNALG